MTQQVWPMQPQDFWQVVSPPTPEPPELAAHRFTDRYPARLADGRYLYLPLREPPARPGFAVASLIFNQASFTVQQILAAQLAQAVVKAAPDIVVGLPTLGLGLADAVARALGHQRYVACGTSRKFWYEDALSVPMRSITSVGDKRLFLDPRLVPLLAGRRVAIIDDVLSTGASMQAGLDLLRKVDVVPVVVGAAMLQTRRWVESLSVALKNVHNGVCGVLHTPLFRRFEQAWIVADETGANG
jgi:adenine/guanine phosphoribosyltransferase-like PRPP-binding protein